MGCELVELIASSPSPPRPRHVLFQLKEIILSFSDQQKKIFLFSITLFQDFLTGCSEVLHLNLLFCIQP